MRTMILAVAAVAFLALSGCSEKVPTGTLAPLASYQVSITGAADIVYHAKSGQNQGSGVPQVGGTLECAQDQVPMSPVPACVPAYSYVNVTFSGLPLPGGLLYNVYLTPASGAPVSLGTLASITQNTTLSKKFDEDLTGKYASVDLFLGGFHFASASAAAGHNAFALAPGATGAAATGTWTGNALDLTVTGIPTNTTLVANLYVNGADGAVNPTPVESFAVTAGANHHETTKHPMNEYSQLHLHVGDSKVNLFKAEVKTNAE